MGGQDRIRRLSACEGKQAFANPKLARRVHQRRKRGHDRERREQEVYRCPCCSLWHIGRRPKPSPFEARRREMRRRFCAEDAYAE